MRKCPNGHAVPVGMAFCPQCGQAVPAATPAEIEARVSVLETEVASLRNQLAEVLVAHGAANPKPGVPAKGSKAKSLVEWLKNN